MRCLLNAFNEQTITVMTWSLFAAGVMVVSGLGVPLGLSADLKNICHTLDAICFHGPDLSTARPPSQQISRQ